MTLKRQMEVRLRRPLLLASPSCQARLLGQRLVWGMRVIWMICLVRLQERREREGRRGHRGRGGMLILWQIRNNAGFPEAGTCIRYVKGSMSMLRCCRRGHELVCSYYIEKAPRNFTVPGLRLFYEVLL